MKYRLPRIRRVLLPVITLLLVSAFLWPALPALANPDGLQIDNSLIQREVRPGETFQHTFMVRSNPSDPDMEILVEAAGFGQTLDGSYQALSAAEDTSPRSAREFITGIDNPSFTLQPGDAGAQEVTVEIQVPPDVTAGGYYALINVRSQPLGDGQVGVVLAGNITVALTVTGGGLTTTGEITELTVDEVESGAPVRVNTVFQNTGNYHYKASNRVTIYDAVGGRVAETTMPLTAASIIPSYRHLFTATFLISEGLEAGEYRVTSEVLGEDDTVKDSRTITLEIEDDYHLIGGIAEASLCEFDFVTTGEPQTFVCDNAGVRIVLIDTVAGENGKLIIGKYETAPETAIGFDASQDSGGTGKSPVRFVDVFISGISQGTAQTSIYYEDEEIADYEEPSFLMAYWYGQAWEKATNITVFTGADYVSGDIPIGYLGGTIIGLGGDTTSASIITSPLLWIIIALVAIAVLIVMIIYRQRKKALWR